ncbi:MAG: Asp-tRNA(Asn)/Glu-tRNA(Gln) amidotransferase GatCAB subunit A [Rhodospirillaceae bacterium]|nr:Asp-tRNA(Asn)/Glu-tRNA(Gln) amidotransferase GatCAB subunit A [Rhodospirillaceae bacterium]
MSSLSDLTLSEAKEGLTKGDFSSRELTESCLLAMENFRSLNAFITETPDRAMSDAETSDQRRAKGEVGALEGLPIAIKDLFCTKGIASTASSRILKEFVPTYESTVTENLMSAGMVMLGKTNLDEFAMGSSNETSYFGPAINPWRRLSDNRPLVPGGSSGGSAAAVSARMCFAATGTDTGGSIRQPAAFCGVVGMKPTYGRCSRWGIVAFASSLDQAGPMTRTVRDAAILLQSMAGLDLKDTTSSAAPIPDFQALIGQDLKGLRIGIPDEYRIHGTDQEILDLWDKGIKWLEDAGAEAIEVSLPHTKYALPTYYIIAPAEASSNLARYDGMRYGLRVEGSTLDEVYENTRAAGFGPEVRRRVLMGTYVLSAGYYDAYYIKAQKVRKLIAEEFSEVFKKVDAILTPTVPSAAFAQQEKTDDLLGMYLNDVMTVPASLAGLPGISVPASISTDGLPLGLQIITKAFDEETLFRVAEVLEQSAGFDSRPNLKV